MTCFLARQQLAALMNEELCAGESKALRRHLLECGDCHEEYEYQARLSSPLRELPSVEPPPDLAMAIRLRISSQQSTGFWQRWQVHLSNLMRPFALPAAGGLLTALILFRVLMPAVWVVKAAGPNEDVPTVLSTSPQFKQASILPVSEDLLVEAWIDEQGRISRFQILNGSQTSVAVSKGLGFQSGDVLLTTVFEPATRFGQRTEGKVLLSLRRINIRG
jgi:hypothetical protein